jgi:divalent metal cation (Fe/Co/Zn/Cd) transporter
MRWLALSAGTFVSWMLLDSMILHTSPPWSDALFALLLGFIPLSCGFAITRYHLYDIDRIVSRTVSYGVVTGLLLLTYSVVVTSVSMILGSQSVVAIALATLVAAALVQPVLRRVQRLVDRRFDRSRYDAVHTIEAFGLRLRDAVDPKSTGDELLDVVAQTMSPAASGLWTRGPASRTSSTDG